MKNKNLPCSVLCMTMLLAFSSFSEKSPGAEPSFDPAVRAELHSIVREKPCQDFFDGALMGNGAMGVVVQTRPSSVVLYLGHNSVWDIRAEEVPMSKLSTFEELWGKLKNGDSSWIKDYNAPAEKAYANSYPRPWPCGSQFAQHFWVWPGSTVSSKRIWACQLSGHSSELHMVPSYVVLLPKALTSTDHK